MQGDGADVGGQEGAAAAPRGARPGRHVRPQLETRLLRGLAGRSGSLPHRLLRPAGGSGQVPGHQEGQTWSRFH